MKRLVILALILATAVKLYLALFTHGSFDMLVYQGHLANVQKLDVLVYRSAGSLFNPFNHPPPIIHWLKFLGWAVAFRDLF